ncbi:glycine C-acetyltransferase [Mesorhizobium sp. CO1-1-8]|uniref:glycine C-acetyltransferase n=1 Tax=Mesorhizobium sp. CO1-1-8 TaxID=2876631 RepID=UPI001CD158F1|nr:glycine C-acetyltransferase [Mesorhizobium sp. CO1-1-8]MBZ9772489.1 glycine C-acetyltransferase [Mesorhizobium sp. CO1-1-8]
MTKQFYSQLAETLAGIESQKLTKVERHLTSAQRGMISISSNDGGRQVLNMCANNYLGLADNPRIVDAARDYLEERGYGMASVRFICGTMDIHRELEEKLANFLGQEDAILYTSCFDANGGLFEPLLDDKDAIISDSLNHASIIDGIRLCKAKRYVYANSDMNQLAEKLREAKANGARNIMVATDGVFSMDGYLAKLPEIVALAREHGALVMVDDSHATGFMGPKGKGTPAHFGVEVDIVTGTFGKALGGAVGGYVAARKPIVDLLRQRSRPYLFSNSLPPLVVGAALAALDLVAEGDHLRRKLFDNARYWRAGIEKLGFDVLPGEHPIIPVMLGDAALSQRMAADLFERGVYVIGFFYPVVAMGKARIRTQMSAVHVQADLDFALDAFAAAREAVS